MSHLHLSQAAFLAALYNGELGVLKDQLAGQRRRRIGSEDPGPVPWRVYLLLCSNGSYYCGATVNFDKRWQAHVTGKGARYTRSFRPVRLLAITRELSPGDARSLEGLVKQQPKAEKLQYLLDYIDERFDYVNYHAEADGAGGDRA